MQQTTTTWHTQTTRTTRRVPTPAKARSQPLLATLSDLDGALRPRDWSAVLASVDDMPLRVAVELRDKLNAAIGLRV